jgi:hypothetical protein
MESYAIAADLRAGKMSRAADTVEQTVHETLTYYAFPDIHWQKIRIRPASTALLAAPSW